jgi:ABC-type bacteriocin/lantibiotic exporter with double-glycine peptidase domain
MQSFAKYQQLEETLTLPREIDEGKSILTGIQNGITFENISFTYP